MTNKNFLLLEDANTGKQVAVNPLRTDVIRQDSKGRAVFFNKNEPELTVTTFLEQIAFTLRDQFLFLTEDATGLKILTNPVRNDFIKQDDSGKALLIYKNQPDLLVCESFEDVCRLVLNG